MKVQVCSKKVDRQTREITYEPFDMLGVNKREAELMPYTNQISGLEDPRIVYTDMRWVHLSTAIMKGYTVVAVETNETIELPALVGCTPESYGAQLHALFS